MQHSHSRHQKTTSNLLRIHLKCKLRFGNGSPLEGAIYINLYIVKFPGHPKILVLCNFLKILMDSDKMIHKTYRTHKITTKPFREIFIFNTLFRGANHYVFPVIITFFPQDYGITFFLHKLRFLKILIVCIKHAL